MSGEGEEIDIQANALGLGNDVLVGIDERNPVNGSEQVAFKRVALWSRGHGCGRGGGESGEGNLGTYVLKP